MNLLFFQVRLFTVRVRLKLRASVALSPVFSGSIHTMLASRVCWYTTYVNKNWSQVTKMVLTQKFLLVESQSTDHTRIFSKTRYIMYLIKVTIAAKILDGGYYGDQKRRLSK